jgi:hypothetical protein
MKTATWAIAGTVGIFVPILFALLWWAVGERINDVLRPTQPPAAISTPTSPSRRSE